MHRQVVLDTETTGLQIEAGHRIIEIGCVELLDRKLTGRHFHYYLNPKRDLDKEAMAVHGITSDFLKDKPTFDDVCDELIQFIAESELIIHNAAFDLGFLDSEILLTKKKIRSISEYCRILDTLQLARRLHAGQRNSLDALCKRYHIDNSKRELHGALLDAHLLARVYLAMTGGQGSFFESFNTTPTTQVQHNNVQKLKQAYPLRIIRATPEELTEHNEYLQFMQRTKKCLWLEEVVTE